MRIYVSDGKVFAELDETIEVCKFVQHDTLQKYKDDILEKISKRFDWTVTEAALKGMELPAEHSEKCDENSEMLSQKADTVSKPQESVSKAQESVSKPQEGDTDQPKELFRAPKDGTIKPETKKTRQRIDYGKIMALHNAGWNNSKIADEMGMTYNAVATAISTYKKKMRVGGGKA